MTEIVIRFKLEQLNDMAPMQAAQALVEELELVFDGEVELVSVDKT